MGMYERKARADAMLGLANNEGMGGGMAAGGMGMGMGMAMAGGLGAAQTPSAGMAPPPPPPPAGYFLYINGQQTGPLPVQQIQQMLAGGQINGQTLAWKQGMAGWAAVSTLPEIGERYRRLLRRRCRKDSRQQEIQIWKTTS